MDFYQVVDQVADLLRRRGRLTYSSLKIQFQLDDAQLEALREEIQYAHESSVQADDRGLIWTGDVEPSPTPATLEPTSVPVTDQKSEPLSYTPAYLAEKILTAKTSLAGERKSRHRVVCRHQRLHRVDSRPRPRRRPEAPRPCHSHYDGSRASI